MGRPEPSAVMKAVRQATAVLHEELEPLTASESPSQGGFHLPAYRKAGIPVAGVTDLDPQRSQSVASDFGIGTTYRDVADAVTRNGTGAIYDIAVPPDAITDILPQLPDAAATLIQKPMGADQDQARPPVRRFEKP